MNTLLSLSDWQVFTLLKSMHGPELVVENFNLGMTLLYTCCLALLTDYVGDPEIQAEFGKLICALVLLVIGVNLLFVIASMGKDVSRKIKKKYLLARHR